MFAAFPVEVPLRAAPHPLALPGQVMRVLPARSRSPLVLRSKRAVNGRAIAASADGASTPTSTLATSATMSGSAIGRRARVRSGA